MKPTPVSPSTSPIQSNKPDYLPLALTLVLMVLYYLYSLKSKGFYQQDEANHYLSMLRFWDNPSSIMGNWAKPGYKIFYVLTALLGQKAVTLQNCAFAAFSCFFAYQTAKNLKASNPWIAFLLLATQPLWIALSFRNYSEFPAGFFLILSFYFFTQGRLWASALLAGLICTIRQEFYPIAGILGVYLLWQRHWFSAVLIGAFPFLQNLAGYALYGDPLYLYHQILGTSEGLKDAYARQGFDHYFLTSAVVFGSIALTLFVLYLAQMVLNKKLENPALLIATLGFFLINCLFNWEEVPIGPATGGNLRYMCLIAPLVSVGGTLAFDRIASMPGKARILAIAIPYLILVGVFLTYKHNFVKLLEGDENRDNLPLIGALFGTALVFIPLPTLARTLVVGGLASFLALLSVKAIKLSEEDKVCQQVADWYKQNESTWKGKPMYNTHIMFYYFLGRIEADFQPRPIAISDTSTMEKAPVGSLVLWDSHYAYRPSHKQGVPIEYFMNSGKYQILQQFVDPDQRFGYILLEKKSL